MLLTPNGRFELNKKICISFTSYHEDLWQPSWGVRTAIIGLQSFFPLKGEAAVGVGGIEVPIHERKRLANISRDWVCPHCKQSNFEALPDPAPESSKVSEGVSAAPAPEAASTAPVDASTTSLSPQAPPAAIEAPSSSSQDPPASMTSTNTITPTPSAPIESSVESLHVSDAAASVHPVQVPIALPTQVPVSQDVNPSRPMDLTPSTPAARVIAQPAPHERGATSISRTNDPHDIGMEPRSAPLILDLAIMALVALLVAILARRFL